MSSRINDGQMVGGMKIGSTHDFGMQIIQAGIDSYVEEVGIRGNSV